tara:strand:+ start:7328 stop:7924 length:597 start_codon:yes stop_codon:yes gene_type:complete
MTEIKSVFLTLSTISVKDKIERKGNLEYLSWANAWAMLKQHYPDAQRKVYEHEHTGNNFFTDGRTAWVKVGITVNSIEHIDYLPIMDFRNAAVHVDKVTSVEVNKTIQRSTAKAIAMHGLGLSLWTGEDVPSETKEVVVAEVMKKEVLKKDTENWSRVLRYVEANKSFGVVKIGQQLNRKYIISAPLKAELTTIITAE